MHSRGAILPGYALIDSDERIPFWRELGRRVHEHDCPYILQLNHAGRERVLPGLTYPKGLELDRRPRADERLPLRAR